MTDDNDWNVQGSIVAIPTNKGMYFGAVNFDIKARLTPIRENPDIPTRNLPIIKTAYQPYPIL